MEIKLSLNLIDKRPIQVGIMQAPVLEFTLHTDFRCAGKTVQGEQKAGVKDGALEWNGKRYTKLYFENPNPHSSTFSLHHVTIGKKFHWEQKETQTFLGDLSLIVSDNQIVAINHIDIEDYLTSVISSEMGATSSLEFLKAHAVISRSWVYSQMLRRKLAPGLTSQPCMDEEGLTWQDQSDHKLFDVCADDHCQRYQGVTRSENPNVKRAIGLTHGEVLTSAGCLCDARFSKCCGGITERYSTCWDQTDYPYLHPVADAPDPTSDLPDLTVEENARNWILHPSDSFCRTTDSRLLHEVLNTYDQQTHHFYRWKTVLQQKELRQLVQLRTNQDIGAILDLIPLRRGASGRIYKLKVVGTEGSLTVGKELTIRRLLSTTHLYSSAFTVCPEDRDATTQIPQSFTLFGAGWGHGVGLCQIGAAVMADQGYTYKQILHHYYSDSQISTL